MKERYSKAAGQVLDEADRIAKQMNSGFVGTQHLLFGLIAVHKGVAEKVLRKNGVTPDRFSSMLEDAKQLALEMEGRSDGEGFTEKTREVLHDAQQLLRYQGFCRRRHQQPL